MKHGREQLEVEVVDAEVQVLVVRGEHTLEVVQGKMELSDGLEEAHSMVNYHQNQHGTERARQTKLALEGAASV